MPPRGMKRESWLFSITKQSMLAVRKLRMMLGLPADRDSNYNLRQGLASAQRFLVGLADRRGRRAVERCSRGGCSCPKRLEVAVVC